jgi:hypothetical protein
VGIDCRGYGGEVELSGLVNIEFSANGMYWYWHGRDGYEDLDTWGDGLYWRSEHLTSAGDPEMNAILSHLEFVPFYYCAIIDSIVDVPGDQGGWARVHFTCSGIDHPDSERDDVIGYTVFRRVDDPSLLDAIDEGPGSIEAPRVRDTGYFVKGGGAAPALPDGTWESVAYTASMPVVEYICLVPTLQDSSAVFDYSVYCIFAQMGFGGGATSPPDSGYSVDNLPPAVPLNLAVEYNTGSGNHVTWDPSPEPDFQFYRIYRGSSESFVPGPASLVYETTLPEWADPSFDGWDVHYKVTSVDASGNESGPASAGTTTGTENHPLPRSFALYQNAPNPFNPTTTIRFDLPRPVHVKLCVYNVKGDLVSTLVDRHMVEGRKEIAWTATSDQGNTVASGIYFYRLAAGDFVRTRKMVLLR